MLRSIETVALAPGLVTGFAEQKQKIPITFFATFHPDPHAVVRAFQVEVKSKLVQVSDASLHIEANLTGLRHLMYRHSWFSAVLGVGTNMFILMTIIGVSWTRFRQGGATGMENLDDVDGMQGMESEEEEDVVEVEEPSSTDAPGQDGDDLQAADVPQPQSICNRLKWFFIRQTFKVMWKCSFQLISLNVAGVHPIRQGADDCRHGGSLLRGLHAGWLVGLSPG